MSEELGFGSVVKAKPVSIERLSTAVGKDGDFVVILHVMDGESEELQHMAITLDNSMDIVNTLQMLNKKINRERKGDNPSWN